MSGQSMRLLRGRILGGCTPFGPWSEFVVSSLQGSFKCHTSAPGASHQPGGWSCPHHPLSTDDKAEVQEGKPQVPSYILDVEAQAAPWEGTGLALMTF